MKEQLCEASDWANKTFGSAELGDARRRLRLVAMATRVAQRPAGTVTAVFPTSAEREGAFRFLENPAIDERAVADAAFTATARACEHERLIYVPLDGSSLTLSDRAGRRELGRVGNSVRQNRGLQVMTALGVNSEGVTIGVLDQQFWARVKAPKKRRERDRKCWGNRYLERETRFWLQGLVRTDERLARHAPHVVRWYQLDRGADCWPVFKTAIDHGLRLTVRAAYNRRIVLPDGRPSYLQDALKEAPVLGAFDLDVTASSTRIARKARIVVRACSVVIHARVTKHRRESFRMQAVLAEEQSPREDRLRWMLLTMAPVENFAQARAVVDGYAMRWRIEEFHRSWKSGVCNVEDSQLHRQSTILKWVTLLAAVAARANRLAQLNRASPNLPASSEFTESEIDAAFLYLERKRNRSKQLVLRDVVNLIADIGGFANKYSGKLPGPIVLGRGLQTIESLARGLENLAKMR
jgi:hypothetical protein